MHFIEELVWECNYTVAKRLVWASNVFGYSTSPSENVDLNPALIKNESKGCFFVLFLFYYPLLSLYHKKLCNH